MTLVDSQETTFYPLVPAPFRLIYSGDVKIYQVLQTLPRAVVIDPQAERVREGLDTGAKVEILSYAPERVEIRADLTRPGRLVLLDADYPGWEASAAGEPLAIIPFEGFFRAVDLPAGEHRVIMTFKPNSLRLGLLATLAGTLLTGALLVWAARRKEVQKAPAKPLE